MCKKIEKHLKRHKKVYLIVLVVALFAVAALVISQTDWLNQMMPELRGQIKFIPKKLPPRIL